MLKRPLIYLIPPIAAVFFCAVYLGVSIELSHAVLLLSLFLALAGAAVYHDRLFNICGVLAAASFAFCFFALYDAHISAPVRALNDQSLTIDATLVQDATVYEDNQRALLSAAPGDKLPGRFRTQCYLPLTETPLLAGDQVRVKVYFYIPGEREGFDRAVYQASNGCFIASAYQKDDEGEPVLFEQTGSSESAMRFLPQRIARRCRELIRETLPEREAGLLTALLLGDKSGISDADMLSIRVAGLSHLIAVSGLHMGFLVAFCTLLGKRIGTWLSIPLILIFVPIAGATPSVIRAAVMYLVAAAGFLLRKEANSLNSLFFALGLLLLMNPYAVASLSLQLSFLATLGLILFAGKMQRWMLRGTKNWPRLARKPAAVIAGALSCTICATMFTFPIILSAFGYVSILSLVSNLLVVGVTAVCFVLGFVLCAAAAVCPPLAKACAFVVRPLLAYILKVCSSVAAVPFGRVSWSDGFGVAAMVVAFGALFFCLLAGERVKRRVVLPGVCVVLCGITLAGAWYHGQRYTVTYLPSGDGQAILLSDTTRHLTVIDCAGDGSSHDAAAEIQEWMIWNGFDRIDTLILTAVDKGHSRDLPALLEYTTVDRICIPEGCRETKHNADLLALVREHDTWTIEQPTQLDDGAARVVLFPIADGKMGVLIADKILVLHSPTQKQLAAYYSETDRIYTAPEIVIAQRGMADPDLLRLLIQTTGAERITLQATTDVMHKFEGIPIQSPYFSGELRETYKKGGNGDG